MAHNPAPQPPAAIGRRRLIAFRALTLTLIGATTLVGLELALRWRQALIDSSNVLDPGLVRYDAALGWSLTPNWRGAHRHHDFSARYSINPLGFRGDTPYPARDASRPLVMVVGDSFTFGVGVDDDQTFVHRLESMSPHGLAFANASVPGYSTDQELLLIERHATSFRPAQVLLVVYLGNDVLDNPLAWPLQVNGAKPYFAVVDDALVLRNTPVPLAPKPNALQTGGLSTAILGTDRTSWTLRDRLEKRSELLRLLLPSVLPEPVYRPEFVERFAEPLGLFALLLDRLAGDCRREHATLTLALVAGRSFFEEPDSVSAQYQQYFRSRIALLCAARHIAAIDLAGLMMQRRPAHRAEWFFPNEGHLTPEGHHIVAEIFAEKLTN